MNASVYVIAEAGVNHDGSSRNALRLVDAAAEAGADCVKFQIFCAEALASPAAQKADYQKAKTGAAESQQAMLKRLQLPLETYPQLIKRARERGIEFLATPFDPPSLAFLLNELDATRIKVGSGDLTNSPMLLEIARSRRDVILSTGMATLDEVEQALSVLAYGYARFPEPPSEANFAGAWCDPAIRNALKGKVVLLHCTTEYPAPANAANLRAINTLAEAFGLPVGYSDHILGIEVALAAVARGAVIIEKHLTLDCSSGGPDHDASLDPRAFAELVKSIRLVEAALGDGRKVPQAPEMKNISVTRKSLVAARAIAKGETFSYENIAIKRPAEGLCPAKFWSVIGRIASRSYESDEPISQ